jgi:hypothetical protein
MQPAFGSAKLAFDDQTSNDPDHVPTEPEGEGDDYDLWGWTTPPVEEDSLGNGSGG